MSNTLSEISLSPTYRRAQRAVAAWYEQRGAEARRAAFGARAALAPLDRVERSRLARWLAWLCLASASQGDATLTARVRRLDPALGAAIDETLPRLPNVASLPADDFLRRSA